MNTISCLLGGAAAAALVSCGAVERFSQPLGDASFDPLGTPGQTVKRSAARNIVPQYQPGTWVETAMANSSFYRRLPSGNADADRVLRSGVPLKVIRTSGDYLKVELDSGEVGFVPSLMVTDRSSGGRASQATSRRSSSPSPRTKRGVPIVPVMPTLPPDTSNELPPLPDPPALPSLPPPTTVPSTSGSSTPEIEPPVDFGVPGLPDPGSEIPSTPTPDLPPLPPASGDLPDLPAPDLPDFE